MRVLRPVLVHLSRLSATPGSVAWYSAAASQSLTNPAKYKLYYFDANGVAEISRMLFALAGVKFEDVRIQPQEWPTKYKPLAPFGQMPWLEIESGSEQVRLPQSTAITHYLAKQFGYAGNSLMEDAQCLMVADTIHDLIMKPTNGFAPEVTDKTLRDANYKRYVEVVLPAGLTLLEKQLRSNQGGDGWFVGNKMSYADVTFAHWMNWMPASMSHTPPLGDFPKLKALVERVEAVPRYAEWLQQRPKGFYKLYP